MISNGQATITLLGIKPNQIGPSNFEFQRFIPANDETGTQNDDVFQPSVRSHTIFGAAGNDTFLWSAENQIIISLTADNPFGGNDTFIGGPGDDSYNAPDPTDNLSIGQNGPYGVDAVIYFQNWNAYNISRNGSEIVLSARLGDEGTDTLRGIKYIQFADRIVDTADLQIARDDIVTTNEDSPFNGNVLNNNGQGPDASLDGNALSVIAVNGATVSLGQSLTLASGARLAVNADGRFIYDPNGRFESLNVGQIANDSFTYTVSDGHNHTDVGTVNITITGVADGVQVTGGVGALNGTTADDQIAGGPGSEIIHGGAGYDWLQGGSGTDNLYGEDGSDILEGGAGNDTLLGGAGDDIMFGDSIGSPALQGDITATAPSTILEFDSSGFDATRVGEPAVVKVGSEYVMLYAGLPFGNNYQIGLATSIDGVTWTKYSSDPVISNSNSQEWGSFRELPVSLLYENGTYELWFNGDNRNLDTNAGYGTGFGYATSSDAVHWTWDADNPIRWELNAPYGNGFSLHEVVKLGDQYHAYFVDRSPADNRFYHALSNDGVHFSGEGPVQINGDYTLLAATTANIGGTPTIFSIWINPDGANYYATSTDGVSFTVGGAINLAPGFGAGNLLVDGDLVKIFGGAGVGNVNWSYGNAVIQYATASLTGGGENGGNDTLTGGPGADIFFYASGDGTDTITDFVPGTDRIDLSGVVGVHNLSDLNISQDGANTVITLGSGIILENVNVGDLNPEDFVFTPAANAEPTDITLSASTVAENSVNGTVVGNLSTTDPDVGDAHTFSLLDDAGGRFSIDGNDIVVAGVIDYESVTSHNVTVRVTDSANNTFDKTITIGVTDVNDNAPVITTAATQSVAENTSVVAALTSTDVDTVGTNPATLSITGGADAAKFDLVGGNLVFKTAPDYENDPHSYQVEVTANDGMNSTAKTITIDLSDVNDNAPTITTAAAQAIAENVAVVAALTSTDVDTIGTNPATFAITGGADADKFDIVGGDLVFLTAPDYETDPHSFQVEVTANDGANTTTETITVEVTNVAGVTINGNARSNFIDATHTVRGQPFPTDEEDIINGGPRGDTIYALGGSDFLNGGSGADKMFGGPGDDTYVVNHLFDRVTENPDEGTDTVLSSITYRLPNNVENLTLTGCDEIGGSGNGLDNTINGNRADNLLAGLAGADTIDGGCGYDTATYAASGAGVVVSLQTGTGNSGDAQGDTLIDIENLIGSNFDDALEGDGGDNILAGGRGIDTVSYENAEARVTVSLARSGWQDTDGAGEDKLSGFENLTGSKFGDLLIGSSGGNVIMGLDGDDELVGGGGADTLTGGDGSDWFIVTSLSDSRPNAPDVITDFVHGTDIIDLSELDAKTTAWGDQAFLFAGQNTNAVKNSVTWFESNGDTIVQADVNGNAIADLVIVLKGIGHDLSASDFLL